MVQLPGARRSSARQSVGDADERGAVEYLRTKFVRKWRSFFFARKTRGGERRRFGYNLIGQLLIQDERKTVGVFTSAVRLTVGVCQLRE